MRWHRGTPPRGREWVHGLLMSAPALFGLIVFVGVPFGYAVVLSFYKVRLGSPLPAKFFGLEQYRRLSPTPFCPTGSWTRCGTTWSSPPPSSRCRPGWPWPWPCSSTVG